MQFEKKYVNTERDISRRVLTISLNDKDIAMVEELKDIFNTHQEGKALKLGAEIGLNVLHSQLSVILNRFHLKRKGGKGE